MLKNKFIQFKHENETWLRTLEYIQQENIFLKNRLAQIVNTHINNSLLKKLEDFQTKFLDKDTIITLLRQDILIQLETISINNLEEKLLLLKILPRQYHLRDDMKNMEREFNKLKFEFNDYLSENIL